MRSSRCRSSDTSDKVSHELHLTPEEPWRPDWVLAQGPGRRHASTRPLPHPVLGATPGTVWAGTPLVGHLKEWLCVLGRGGRKESDSQVLHVPGSFMQMNLPTDGSVSGPTAAPHDHFLPECVTLREVPGSWQQLRADSRLQVPLLPLLGRSSTCTPWD